MRSSANGGSSGQLVKSFVEQRFRAGELASFREGAGESARRPRAIGSLSQLARELVCFREHSTCLGTLILTWIPLPEIDAVHYLPRNHIPTLLIGGRDDYIVPVETNQKPFMRLLGTAPQDKRYVMLDCGHNPTNFQTPLALPPLAGQRRHRPSTGRVLR
jgi:hypothetical protein